MAMEERQTRALHPEARGGFRLHASAVRSVCSPRVHSAAQHRQWRHCPGVCLSRPLHPIIRNAPALLHIPSCIPAESSRMCVLCCAQGRTEAG